MPRYRVAFSRDWALGRWGYLDRFFHDLGGRESEPAGLQNAWVVAYRGPARRLGRELAMALHIQEADYLRFGPIFEIEEIAGERRAGRKSPAPGPAPAASGETSAEPQPAAAESSSGSTAPPSGPSWVADAVVEDVSLGGEAAPGEGPHAPAGFGKRSEDPGLEESLSSRGTQDRWDDLFRIRKQSRPRGHRRADAIAGASRRRAPGTRPPPQ
jgi:hypothetical protein